MSITLFCLDASKNVFPVHIDKGQSIGDLKEAIRNKINVPDNFKAMELKLWKVKIPDDRYDLLSNLTFQDQDKLIATKKISKYFPDSPPEEHIHVIVKLPLLSLEEALSCIPPPITYAPKDEGVTSKTTTKVCGDPPSTVSLWEDFFEEVNRFRFDQQPLFERPNFVTKEIMNETDVQSVLDFNICQTLNHLMGLGCVYSRRPTHTPGIPDFNCYLVRSLLILVIEVKRRHVLEDINEMTFPEFYYASEKAKMVVQQIYNYMGANELRYGILTTYDNHWFLRRDHTDLQISKTLSLDSKSPPVLKAYAYLTRKAKENPISHNPQILVSANGDNNSRTLRSHTKFLSSSSISQQSTSVTNQEPSSNIPAADQHDFSFTDFKFKSILGEGRSGKTLLCEFRDDTIALKSVDLSKAPRYVLEEMQNEVEIYKELVDFQGKYIPKLVCYGYYGGGMSFVIGMTIVGTSLRKHKITKQQKSRAIEGLSAIHKRGILHNDIREENILINDFNDIYLVDFGIASRGIKNKGLFRKEQLKYSKLLDRYINRVK